MAPDALLAGANLVAGFAARRLLPANTALLPLPFFSLAGCCVAERFRPVLAPEAALLLPFPPPLELLLFFLFLLSVVLFVFFFAVFATEVDAFLRLAALVAEPAPAALAPAVAPAPFLSTSLVVLLFFSGDLELLPAGRPAAFAPPDLDYLGAEDCLGLGETDVFERETLAAVCCAFLGAWDFLAVGETFYLLAEESSLALETEDLDCFLSAVEAILESFLAVVCLGGDTLLLPPAFAAAFFFEEDIVVTLLRGGENVKPSSKNLAKIGALAQILKSVRLSSGERQVEVHVLERV